MMKKFNIVNSIIVLLCSVLSWPVFASDLSQQQSTLYPYRNSIQIQDDFVTGTTNSGTIGQLGFGTGGGVTSGINSVANRLGIIRRDTSAVINTTAIITLTSNVTSSLDPALPTQLLWVARLNTNDANTTIRIGAASPSSGLPPNDGIYIEKLDADTNWFCVTRAATVQTRTDSTVAITTNFANFAYTRNSSGVQFSIDNVNVCSLITTNIPTVFFNPLIQITNSAAVSKTVDVDYFQLNITGIVR